MNSDEARLLIEAWNYFDSHPKEKFWEGLPGISRDEFYRLMPVITGIENLVEAKNYLGRVAQGRISETVPGTIIEKAKEGEIPKPYLEDARRATASVRAWLKNIKPKGQESLAFRQVAAAQVKAELARIEESRTERPKIETAPLKTPAPIPETIATSFPPEESVPFGIKITPAELKAFGESVGKAGGIPFKLVSFFAPPKVLARTPQATAALASAMSLSQISAKAQDLPEIEKKHFLRIVENLRQAEFSFYGQVRLSRTIISVREITILMGPEFGMTQGEAVALVRGGAPSGRGPSFISGVGRQIFGGLAQRAVTKAATKAVTSALTKAEVSITTKAVAVAAGAPAGPVGIAIGLAVGWLVDKAKDLGSWLIRNAPKVAIGLGALLFGTGFALNSSLLMGTGGLVGFGGLVGQAGGVGPALSRAGGFASSVITGITSLAVASIATPLIVALISIPVLVAIILFIINSGAYIVPPSSFSVLEENPHIGIVKEVSPSGPFENSNLPLTVTYTITITAKRGTLTNIGFEHKCGAIAKNSTNSCPAPLPQSIPQEISPVEPYVFTYTQTYSGSSYRDSLVINTFTVTADTPETTGASASGVASIIIGNPPTGCYKVAGTWPANERAAIMAATSNLVGRSPTFVARLCAAYSQVNLYYDPSKVCGVWGCAPGGNVIYFNSAGLGNTHNATYILAHESGHVLAYGSPNLYQAYLAFPGTLGELPVCTYGGTEPAEGFAEAIARYAVGSACLSNEPNNKSFVETHIFR